MQPANSTDNRNRQVLYQREWLNLVKNIDRRGRTSFAFEFYIPKNRRFSKTIAFSEEKALSIWHENLDSVEPLETKWDRQSWIESRVVSPPRRAHGARKTPVIQFEPSLLGKKLDEYCRMQWEKPIERSSKNTVYRICKDLERLSGKAETLTNTAVKNYFKIRMNPDHHLSPETLKCDRTEIRRLAIWLGVRDLEGLFKDVYIPTKSQLLDHGIKFRSRNRRHLERPEVEAFVNHLVNYPDKDHKTERDSLLIQLILGSRPQEAPCAELLATSIVIAGSWKQGRAKSLKTARKGVDTIVIARKPVINAILFLTDCNPKPISTEDGSKLFRKIARSALGRASQGLDRYCLRHTALSWLVLSPDLTQKEVGDMAGHMGARMIQDVYANRRVKDQRTWEEAMPLAIRHIPRTWHGFLLECVMVSIWPELKQGKKPSDDPRFQRLAKILRDTKEKRGELDLF